MYLASLGLTLYRLFLSSGRCILELQDPTRGLNFLYIYINEYNINLYTWRFVYNMNIFMFKYFGGGGLLAATLFSQPDPTTTPIIIEPMTNNQQPTHDAITI
jgi:hypothetical protein